MNVPALQKIDRWVGVPACFILTLLRKIFGRKLPPGPASPRNILFVKLAEQGSTVLASSALTRAVQMVGRENVFFITFKENRFILDLLQIIPEENVITISRKTPGQLISTTRAAVRRMRGLALDAAIDMEFFARGSVFMLFLGQARIAGI